MTTLVVLPTKDAVVMGCDSLATVARPMIDPRRLFEEYFDSNGSLKTNSDGKPLLHNVEKALEVSLEVPIDHMTDVDKLFSLEPLQMGAMFTGITAIGDRTVKGLLSDFKAIDPAFDPSTSNYTVKSVAERFLDYLSEYYAELYDQVIPELRPSLQIIFAGYNKSGPFPQVATVDVKRRKVSVEKEPFWPVFAGQSREIERIVYGLDLETWIRIEKRLQKLLQRYGNQVATACGVEEDDFEIPRVDKNLRMFADGFQIPGISASWGDFSEQNAIDCVAYFVRIMREAQRFSARMPTVGGAIHVALVDREMGFRFISRREYSHEDHRVHRDGTKVEATQERGSGPASVSTDRGSLSEFGGNQATQRGSIRARAGC